MPSLILCIFLVLPGALGIGASHLTRRPLIQAVQETTEKASVSFNEYGGISFVQERDIENEDEETVPSEPPGPVTEAANEHDSQSHNTIHSHNVPPRSMMRIKGDLPGPVILPSQPELASSQLEPVSSQVDLSLVERYRSYVRETSVGVLVGIAVLAFMFGICCVMSVPLLFSSPPHTSRGSSSTSVLTFEVPEGHVEDNQAFPAQIRRSESQRSSRSSQRLMPPVQEDSESDLEEPLEDLMLKYDFESEDDLNQKTHYWQWCSSQQLDRLNLVRQAPTQPSEGYERIDVSATHAGVQEFLRSSNIDFNVFDMSIDGENLLWKLLRNEAYFMLIDADLPTRRVLVMMETVRMRWVQAGHVLIEKCDPAKQGFCLPGQGRPNSEAPIEKAKEMWKDVFKLPTDTAHFVEISTEDNDIVCYKGLHCKERNHIIEVILEGQVDHLSSDAMYKVGLPSHNDFSIQDPHNKEQGLDVHRNFTWMTMEACKSSGLMAGGYKPVSSLDATSLDSTASSREQVAKFLQNVGVDAGCAKWQAAPESGCNKLEQLAEEVASGKCCITSTSEGVNRCVNAVSLRIWSPDQSMMLVEKGCKDAEGEEDWNVQLPGCERSINESLTQAGMRVCEQQLSFTDEHVSFHYDSTWEYYEYTEEFTCYLGLPTKYQIFFVDLILEDDEDLWERVGPKDSVFESLAGAMSTSLSVLSHSFENFMAGGDFPSVRRLSP